MGTFHNDSPEALLAIVPAFPAKLVISHPPTLIQEKGKLQFPFFAHSQYRASLIRNYFFPLINPNSLPRKMDIIKAPLIRVMLVDDVDFYVATFTRFLRKIALNTTRISGWIKNN